MVIYAPKYYSKFKCIADKCRHNCCIGWDVEIDDDTLSFYKSLRTELGERFRNYICFDGEKSYFKMRDNGKCPFLNESGLCDVISGIGEKNIPYICRMHPRFKNVFSGREEIGLGLCCEEVAGIILNEREPFSLEIIAEGDEHLTDFEKELLSKRQEMFEIFNRADISFNDKISASSGLLAVDEKVCICRSSYESFDLLEYMGELLPEIISGIRYDEDSFSGYASIPKEVTHDGFQTLEI